MTGVSDFRDGIHSQPVSQTCDKNFRHPILGCTKQTRERSELLSLLELLAVSFARASGSFGLENHTRCIQATRTTKKNSCLSAAKTMMMLTSATTTTAAINDITTSSRDDFDRSFDYWSKGDTTGSRGSGAVSPDEEEEEYEYDAEEGDAYQYDGDEQQQQQQQPHDTPTRGGPPVGTGPPASSWLHHIQAAASSLHPTSHGTNRDDGAPPPASVVENDEGDYDYEYDEDEVGEDGPPRLRLAVHEQLSAAYGDDPSAEPSCRLEGCVYAQYSGGTDNLLLRTAQSLSSSLEPPQIRLVLRDPLGQLVRVDPDTRYCNNNATSNGSDDNDTADHRVLLVRVPPDTEPGRLRLASYGCAIRPVPLVRMIVSACSMCWLIP